MSAKDIEKVLSGPAGYAIAAIAVTACLLYLGKAITSGIGGIGSSVTNSLTPAPGQSWFDFLFGSSSQ